MRNWPRVALASSSVAIVGAVGAVGAAVGPAGERHWILLCGALAVVAALQSVTSERKDLRAALLLSLVPVVALVSDGSPTWLIAPLAAALLVAGELNALSWEGGAEGAPEGVIARRLQHLALLGAVGLGGGVAVYAVASVSFFAGTGAVVLAALALAGLGYVVFRSSGAFSHEKRY